MSKTDNKAVSIIDNNKKQEVVERHAHPHPERATYTERDGLQEKRKMLSIWMGNFFNNSKFFLCGLNLNFQKFKNTDST